MQQQTVFVVDDDPGTCAVIADLVRSVRLPVQTYADGRAFLAAVRPGERGCVVLDVRMPELGGLDVQDTLQAQQSTLRVIVVTGHADVATAVRALQGGAVDVIQKPFSGQILLDRVRRALDLEERAWRAEAEGRALAARVARLSPREREVLELLVAGATTQGIADRLGVSVKTAAVHRGNVMRKTGVDSLAELVRVVLALRRNAAMPRPTIAGPAVRAGNPASVGGEHPIYTRGRQNV